MEDFPYLNNDVAMKLAKQVQATTIFKSAFGKTKHNKAKRKQQIKLVLNHQCYVTTSKN